MKNNYQALIVGGGASGLTCAIELLRAKNCLSGSDVLILEKNDRVGKKLIATGNGQGNLSNANLSCSNYHGDKSFIDAVINNPQKINVVNYLEELGVFLTTSSDGKIYPISKQASAVLDILREYLANKGCTVNTCENVVSIAKGKDDWIVKTQNGSYTAKNVVLAFGGAVGKQFGTDGSSYSLVQNLGYKVTKLYPSLVQLKTDTTFIRGLKGLKERARVIAYDGNVKLAESVGDLLFTEFGVSGNAIFQVSAYLTDAKNPSISVEFLPDYTLEQVKNLLVKKSQIDYISKEEILVGILNKRIGQAILKRCNSFSPDVVAKQIKNFSLKVTGNLGFNYAQVTKGGVQTDQINPLTMQSKINKGLYIIGEALDVDGDCGGYNLTFAFLTGILSAINIKNDLK